MDKLDRLLADLDDKVADAQSALADLARVRRHQNPSDHTVGVSFWRRGIKGHIVAHVAAPTEVESSTGHAQFAERHAMQRAAQAGQGVQEALVPLSALLGQGPDLRALQVWPAFHVLVGIDATHAALSLTGSAPSRVAYGASWSWEDKVFHNACRVLLDNRTKFGRGGTWTIAHRVDTRPADVCKAEDAESALVLFGLRSQQEVLDPSSSDTFVLSRVDPNVEDLLTKIRGSERRSTRRRIPFF